MRGAIAKEKGDGERWDLKYAAGGLIDIEFIAQYLQLVHARRACRIFSTPRPRACSTRRARLGVLATEDAEVLRPAVRLYQNLTQILRLCLPGAVRSQDGRRRAAAACWRAPPTCRISPRSKRTLIETQAKVRASFVRILGKAP